MLAKTPTLPDVATLPATATLPEVAMLPATAMLPAVATLPATAMLPAVATVPAVARDPAVATPPPRRGWRECDGTVGSGRTADGEHQELSERRRVEVVVAGEQQRAASVWELGPERHPLDVVERDPELVEIHHQ